MPISHYTYLYVVKSTLYYHLSNIHKVNCIIHVITSIYINR